MLPLSICAAGRNGVLMELGKFGIDTVRVAHDLKEPLPMHDEGYRHLLAQEWTVNVRTERDEVLGLFESRTAYWQDAENPTIRAQIQNAGRTVVAEYSVPRVLTGSILNTRLATAEEALDVTALLRARLREVTPEMGDVENTRFRRVDLAGDINAGEARPGLIAAAGQFYVPGARKVVRNIFPGETGRVTTTQLTFRGYDKARELENKTAKVLRDLDQVQRESVEAELRAQREAGTVRLELALTPKKNPLTEGDVMTGNIKWADVVEAGFRGGVITIGGLDYIRREVDSRGNLSPQGRDALIAFAVRYAELGEDGMLAVMPKRTFYRKKKMFLDAGLRLDDVCTYSGEMDLKPVLEQVRAM